MDAIIAIDLEANGLHGQPLALAVTVSTPHGEQEAWTSRCPVERERADPRVAAHVVPLLRDIPVTHRSYAGMLSAWRSWYAPHKEAGTPVVAYVAWPVEARFLWDAHRAEPFSGPFPLVDVASMIPGGIERPETALQDYAHTHGIPPTGPQHHPLADARLTAAVFWHHRRTL